MFGWHHQLNKHEFQQTPGDVKDRQAWHTAVHGVTKTQMQLSDSKTTHKIIPLLSNMYRERLRLEKIIHALCYSLSTLLYLII